VIDITMESYGLVESITVLEVSMEPSLSDHSQILFTLRGSVPVPLIGCSRGSSLRSFREGLRDNVDRVPEMNIKE